jgi:uncharacterized membrane protein
VLYGDYYFRGDALGPRLIFGVLPICIPVAWYAMAIPSWYIAASYVYAYHQCLSSPLSLQHESLRPSSAARLSRIYPLTMIILSSIILTCTDIVGDPVLSTYGGHLRFAYDSLDHVALVNMTHEGDWVWYNIDAVSVEWKWFGVPFHNFIGWIITSLIAFSWATYISNRYAPAVATVNPSNSNDNSNEWYDHDVYISVLPITLILSTGLFYATHGTIQEPLQITAIIVIVLPAVIALLINFLWSSRTITVGTGRVKIS